MSQKTERFLLAIGEQAVIALAGALIASFIVRNVPTLRRYVAEAWAPRERY